MVKMICINGMPKSGKDTFVQMVMEYLPDGMCKNVSTVDYVKEVATEIGWDGTKTPKNRKFLSDLKDLLAEWDDVPYRKVGMKYSFYERYLEMHNINLPGLMFVHTREPEEIARFQEEYGALTVIVRRAAVEEAEQSNHADANVFNFHYDVEIDNNGDLFALRAAARKFVEEMGYRV